MDSNQPSFLRSTRFVMAIVGFLGCAVIYSVRVNLSVAVVCMVNHTAVKDLDVDNDTKKVSECVKDDVMVGSEEDDGPYPWNKAVQGRILSAFFWGYLFTQILGGWLAQRFGGVKIIFANVLISTICTFLTPLAAQLDYQVLMALRVIMGFAQGSTFPGFHTLWTKWAPPNERSKLTGLTYAGLQVGNFVAMPLSGVLCKHGFAGGWPSIFYVLGIFGAIWLLVWLYFASDSPSSHRRINAAEKQYIMSTLSHDISDSEENTSSVPWLSIMKSLPVWACYAGHFAGDWGAYLMLTCLPTFLREVLRFDMTSLGFLASVPYIAYFVCINVAGVCADFLISRHILSIVNTRRVMMIIGLCSQAIFLIAAGYCPCGQEMVVIALLSIGMGLSGFQYSGFIVSYMEIAPRYAGPIVGIGNTLSCLGGIIAPQLMSIMTEEGTRQSWLNLFYVTAAILIAGTIVFCIFIKDEVQPWAAPTKQFKPTELRLLDDTKMASAKQNADDMNKTPLYPEVA